MIFLMDDSSISKPFLPGSGTSMNSSIISTSLLHQVYKNILVVKSTADARLKEIHAKATVITIASFDIGRLKKSLKEEER